MKTKLFIVLAVLLTGAISRVQADTKESLLAMKESLAPVLEECQNLQVYYYGELIAVRQICPFITECGAYGEKQKTLLIDIKTNTRWRIPSRQKLLD